MPSGMSAMPTTVMSFVRESIISDFVERTLRRASAASFARIALEPTCVSCTRARPEMTKLPDFSVSPGFFQNGIGLASQQRLIDLQLAVAHDSVRADLVARRKFHDVIADKLIRPHGDALAGADGLRRSRRDERQLIDGALSADLLKATDDCVSHSDEQKHQILERADKAQAQRQHQEDQVEEGQDILLDDLPLGLRIGRRHNVAQAVALPELDLLRRKALCRVCLQHRDLAIDAQMRLLGFCFITVPQISIFSGHYSTAPVKSTQSDRNSQKNHIPRSHSFSEEKMKVLLAFCTVLW